jgi:hypothetical protein
MELPGMGLQTGVELSTLFPARAEEGLEELLRLAREECSISPPEMEVITPLPVLVELAGPARLLPGLVEAQQRATAARVGA